MSFNWKAAIKKPLWNQRSRKCGRILKKMKDDPERFSLQWRNDLVSKYASKMLDDFKVKLKIVGVENLSNSGPAILIGNHQDYCDAFIMMKALQKTTPEKDEQNKISTFLAKEELKYNKLTRYPLELIDVFFLERDNLRKSLETYKEFGKFVKAQKTYGIIFPEGTRNRTGTIDEFKPGAFKIAQKELIPIIPFTINNSVGGFNWKRTSTLEIEIIFHKKIPAASFINQSTNALAERVQKIVESSFTPPQNAHEEISEASRIKAAKREAEYYKNKQKQVYKENKQKLKIEKQENKIREQDELETKKFIEAESKKKQKKESKNKDKKWKNKKE
ncbi:MAG: lysophospholipid acyltransferase family protein [Metamycoplasmataceae bacterium]